MKNRIKKVREQSNMTAEEVADRIGMSQSYYSRVERAERPIKLETLHKIARVLNVRTSDLIDEPFQPVPISGYVGAGQKVFPYDDVENSEHAETVMAPASLGKVAAVKVRGKSMQPIYREDDVIFYRPHKGHPSALLNRECIVKVVDGPTLIKIVQHSSRDGHFTLSSYNADPMLDAKIEWAGPVLWVKRDGE